MIARLLARLRREGADCFPVYPVGRTCVECGGCRAHWARPGFDCHHFDAA